MDRKNTLLLTVIAVATLLVAVVGATFAYFTAQAGAGANTPITVTTSTSDSLIYDGWTAISLTPNQINMAQGAAPVKGETYDETGGTVTLTANSQAQATYCYNAELNITTNQLTYTTAPTNTPELTILVKKNNVNVIDTMDITTQTQAVKFPTVLGGTEYKHTLTADASQTIADTWNITVTFVNLDTDQQANTNKSFVGAIKFTTVDCQ